MKRNPMQSPEPHGRENDVANDADSGAPESTENRHPMVAAPPHGREQPGAPEAARIGTLMDAGNPHASNDAPASGGDSGALKAAVIRTLMAAANPHDSERPDNLAPVPNDNAMQSGLSHASNDAPAIGDRIGPRELGVIDDPMSEGKPHELPGGEDSSRAPRFLAADEIATFLSAKNPERPDDLKQIIVKTSGIQQMAAVIADQMPIAKLFEQEMNSMNMLGGLLAEQAVERIAQLAAIWGKQSRDIARRNRDRAQMHIAPEHIAAALPRIDWQAFLAEQRGDASDGYGQVLAGLNAAFAVKNPAADNLREAIAHELLYLAWADVAEELGLALADFEHDPETGDAITTSLTVERLAPGSDWAAFSARYVERDILEDLWADYLQSTLAAIPEPEMRPILSDDGTMLIASTGFVMEAWRGLSLGERGFTVDASGYPSQRLRQTRGVNASLTMTADSLPVAWDRVKSLGKGSPEVFIGLVAQFMQTRTKPALWGSHDGYISRDILTKCRGAKMHNRAYRAEDSRDTVEAVAALDGIYINGSHKVWTRAKEGGRKRPVDLLIRGKAFTLDIIPRTGTPEEVEAFLASGPGWGSDISPENIAGWAFRFGPWADCLREGTPTFAKMLCVVMDYPAVQGLYARRLGFVLTMAFRTQAHERNWSQPYRIGRLLDDAGIDVALEKNKRRVIERFSAALEWLNRDGVIASATYADGSPIATNPPASLGKKWFEQWLGMGVIVTPPSSTKSDYHAIGQQSATAAAGTVRTRRRNASRTIKLPPKA